jgi:hypothetical protein
MFWHKYRERGILEMLENATWFCSLITVVLTLSAMIAESFDK